MFCAKCGKEIAEGAKFCPGCGAPTGRAQQGRQESGERPARQSVQTDIPVAASGGRNLKVMLAAFLGVLALAGIGAGIFFLVSGRGKGGGETAAETQTADTAAETQTAEGARKVTSDTNEVVNDRILDNVPKAVSAYDFEDGADGAQAVVRNDVEQQPEAADVAVQYVDGIEGRAVYLDGTYGLKLNSVGRIGESYTVAFWIKADALYDWSPFIHISYDILDPDRRCRLWVGQKTDGSSVAPILSSEQARDESIYEIRPDGMDGTMQPGVWYYIVFTVDGTRSGGSNDSVLGTLYVGGEKVGEGDVARDVMNADDPEIDLGINCWDTLFPAAYDGVKIWNRTLDEEQVKELYQAYGAGGETAEAADSAAQADAEQEETEQWVCVKETRYYSNYYPGEPRLQETGYEYDAAGNQTKIFYYNADGSGYMWDEHEYDEAGHMTKSTSYLDSDGKILSQWEAEYDAAGNPTKEILYWLDGSIDSLDSRIMEYEYDADGICTEVTGYDIDGNLRSRREYTYDPAVTPNPDFLDTFNDYELPASYIAAGACTKMVNYDAAGNENSRAEWEYDAAGHVIKYMHTSASGDGSVMHCDEYEYDAAGNKMKETFYNADGSISSWTEYEYDEAGNKMKETFYNADGSISSWLEYEYDEAGNKTKETSYGVDGSISSWTEYEYQPIPAAQGTIR